MLYPIKKPFAIHEIKEGHILYLEEYGKKIWKPVLFLHGGPGSGCANWQKGLFNNKIYRVIDLDQRFWKIFPKDYLKIILLRLNRGYRVYKRIFKNRQMVFLVGGSWGSMLAIAYSEKYPKY